MGQNSSPRTDFWVISLCSPSVLRESDSDPYLFVLKWEINGNAWTIKHGDIKNNDKPLEYWAYSPFFDKPVC